MNLVKGWSGGSQEHILVWHCGDLLFGEDSLISSLEGEISLSYI